MKLCSRLFVLYCRSCPKDDKCSYFDPHFEEVMGGVEPWLIARWKARVEFLLSVIELLFVSLTVAALQGQKCQDSLLSGEGRSLGAKISGGRGRPWGIFCYLNVQTPPCYVPSFDTIPRVTDRRTDRGGIAVASTALAMRALWRAVKRSPTRWLYCVECPQYSTRRRSASNIHSACSESVGGPSGAARGRQPQFGAPTTAAGSLSAAADGALDWRPI